MNSNILPRPTRQLWRIYAFRRQIGDWESPDTECGKEVLGKFIRTTFNDRNDAEAKADRIRNREAMKPSYPGSIVRVEVRPAIDIY
ncbi:MAG: hypothetical protein WC360_03730 [Opitutales bacterium]|jgi:hypothetical protein